MRIWQLLLTATADALRLQMSRSDPMWSLPGQYHTSDAIHKEIVRMPAVCKRPMTIETIEGIDTVTVGATNSTTRAFILFGEHARELVSSETALSLLRRICSGQEGEDVLFKIMPNANPRGRSLVESGETCRRTNPEGIDINRNWENPRATSLRLKNRDMEEQTYGGEKAFSTIETRTIRDQLVSFKPDLFISIHSGTFGMYTPYANDQHKYETVQEQADFSRMKTLVEGVDSETCNCPLGEAVVKVGYSSWGTCIDWVYQNLHTPYVYAFEIYTGGSSQEDCFGTFNPSGSSLDEVTRKWSSAVLKVASLVHPA